MKIESEGLREFLRYAWETLVLLAALVVGFAIPLRIVLLPGVQPIPVSWDVGITLLFGADLVIRLRGRMLSARKSPLAWLWLGIDLLATLPLGRALGMPAAHLFRLTKLLRMLSIVSRWRRTLILHPTVMRLAA